MRLAIVQFGDYREAFLRFREGGPETYYAQRYSVDFVEDISRRHEFVGVCAMLCETPYEEALTGQLSAAGVPRLANGAVDERQVCALLERWRITHLVLQTPAYGLLAWALSRNIKTLPLFADSWENRGLKARLHAFRLARLLNDPRIDIVANHNVPASLSLRRIGVDAEKIIPWDWPHALTPDQFPVKQAPGRPSLVFIGAMTERKGPGDCIEAARFLAETGLDFTMELIGAGDFEEKARGMIAAKGLQGRVALGGRLPHAAVIGRLKQASVALVPSRHSYPEGLPMTIYEALATRTPLVMSDHPMFRLFFCDTPAVRMAPQHNPSAIAKSVTAFLSDPDIYAAASVATGDLWKRIKGDLTWGALIDAWLEEPEAARDKLRAHSLPERLAALA